VLAIAIVGPFVMPHSPIDPAAAPYGSPGGGHLLGTDNLGRDVLSRVLDGGWRLLAESAGATIAAYLIGTALGVSAAYRRGVADDAIMRTLDVLLCFPPILLLLLLAAGAGPGVATIVVGVIAVNVPGIARVARAAAAEIVGQPYIEAAVLRGERRNSILRREVLPNITGSLLADAGPRFSGSIILIAGLNYLAIGVSPPTPDWGAMIFENRSGMTVQPWPIAAPAVLIVVLVVSINLLGDAFARSRGRRIASSPLPA
jgi:peptide/nickel transport system permease protein